MTRNKLYTFISVLSLLGYAWLGYQTYSEKQSSSIGQICMFKATTTLPCPSCGSTRSVIAIFQGNLLQALYFNPLGLIIVIGLLILPLWIISDVLLKKDSFFKFYIQFEKWVVKKPMAISLITIILLNWVWNIYKDL